MEIKIQCHCGTKFAFDVEPVNGQMPWRVQCPACGMDGTDAANAVLRQILAPPAAAPRPAVPVPAAPAVAAPTYCRKHPDDLVVAECHVCGKPICGKCMELFGFVCSVYCRDQARARGLAVPVFEGQAEVIAAKTRAKIRRVAAVVGVLLAALVGGWIWYSFVGSRPKVVFSLQIPKGESDTFSQLVPPDQLVVVSRQQVSLYSLQSGKPLWSTPLTGGAPQRVTRAVTRPSALDPFDTDFVSHFQVHVTADEIWVVLAERVARLDRQTGKRKEDVAYAGPLQYAAADDTSLVIVSGEQSGRTHLTRIPFAGGKAQSEEIVLAPPTRRPAAARATAADALADFMAEPNSQFFAAGVNVAQFKVRLLEKKTEFREAMRRQSGEKVFETGRITGANAMKATTELLNDMQRDATGGVEEEDVSRYEITLRRWLPANAADWTGEAIGRPRCFPQKTVDVVTAGRSLHVFSKKNQKLWEAKLTYPISPRFDSGDAHSPAPCLESGSTLYFFDQGMLSAFDLKSGQARWRLPSAWISSVRFDHEGKLIVTSTTASPDAVKFSQQINLAKKVDPLTLRIDPADGKVLWQVQGLGERCFVSGKFLYATRAQLWSAELIGAMGDESAMKIHHRVRRLDPATGKEMWEHYRTKGPTKVDFQRNCFLLQYRDELQVLRFLSF